MLEIVTTNLDENKELDSLKDILKYIESEEEEIDRLNFYVVHIISRIYRNLGFVIQDEDTNMLSCVVSLSIEKIADYIVKVLDNWVKLKEKGENPSDELKYLRTQLEEIKKFLNESIDAFFNVKKPNTSKLVIDKILEIEKKIASQEESLGDLFKKIDTNNEGSELLMIIDCIYSIWKKITDILNTSLDRMSIAGIYPMKK